MTENARDGELTIPKGMDAREWAQSLMAHSKRYGFEIDEETMLGWFANAIMAGYDEGRRRLRAESLERAAALEAQDEKPDGLDDQIDRLAKFIMAEIPGEPSQSQGAVDTAIRIMADLNSRLAAAEQADREADSIIAADVVTIRQLQQAVEEAREIIEDLAGGRVERHFSAAHGGYMKLTVLRGSVERADLWRKRHPAPADASLRPDAERKEE